MASLNDIYQAMLAGIQALNSLNSTIAGTTFGFTINIRKFTASGTYTPSANLMMAVAEVLGGGGAGGGAIGATSGSLAGHGGSSAGYSKKVLTPAMIGASLPVTIGVGGVGAVGASGGNGTASSLGSLCISNGGLGGGVVGTSNYSIPGPAAGAAAGTGDITAPGQPGGLGGYISGGIATSGLGGATFLGAPGPPTTPTSGTNIATGANAVGYGAGGNGGIAHTVASNLAGGNGAPGIVVVTEFIAASVTATVRQLNADRTSVNKAPSVRTLGVRGQRG